MLTFRKQPDRGRQRRRSGSPAVAPLVPAPPALAGYSYEAVRAEIDGHRGLKYYLYCLVSIAELATQPSQTGSFCRCEKLKQASRTHNQDPTKSIGNILFELLMCAPTRVQLHGRTMVDGYHFIFVSKRDGVDIHITITHDDLLRLARDFPPTLPPAILIQLPRSAAWACR